MFRKRSSVQSHEATIDIAGSSVFIKIWTPDGREDTAPILLFHDSLGCVALWKAFPEHLAAVTRRQVIAYDRIGFGLSGERRAPADLDFITEEAELVIRPLCQKLGLQSFIACGHSVGGAIAIEAAARLPALCKGVVTIATQAFVEDKTLEGILQAKADFSDIGAFSRLSRYHGNKTRSLLNAWIDIWLSPAFANWTLDAALAERICPVLAIHGDKDEYGTVAHAERVTVKNGKVHIVKGSEHFPHRTHEEEVIRAIAGWLGEEGTKELLD